MKKTIILGALLVTVILVALYATNSSRRGENPRAVSHAHTPSSDLRRELDPAVVVDAQLPPKRTVRATSEQAESTPTEAVPAQVEVPSGEIVVRLVDGLGAPVSPGVVSAIRHRLAKGVTAIIVSAPVDQDGIATLAVVPGSYRVTVAQEGLAAGFTAPKRQSYGVPVVENPGMYAPIVPVLAGQSVEVPLTCFKLGTVVGHVARFDGGSLENLRVSLRTLDGIEGLTMSTTTDATGAFVFEDVSPGALSLRASSAEDEESLVLSESLTIQSIEGGAIDVGGIQLGIQGATIRGRLVDGSGTPFDDLRVIAFPDGERMDRAVGQGRSDAIGVFDIPNVPAGRMRVTVNEFPLELNTWMKAVLVDVDQTSGTIELGDILLERSSPFSLTVRVRVSDKDDERRVRLKLEHQLPDKDRPEKARLVRKSVSPGEPVEPYPKTLTYLWVTKKSMGTAVLTFKVRRHQEVIPISPTPNGSQEIDLDASGLGSRKRDDEASAAAADR